MAGPRSRSNRRAAFVGVERVDLVGRRGDHAPRHVHASRHDLHRTAQVAVEEAGPQVGMARQHRSSAQSRNSSASSAPTMSADIAIT